MENGEAGSPFGLPASPYDYRERRGKNGVCSSSFLLDVAIISKAVKKVNRFKELFTICLQTACFHPALFTNRSKNIANLHIDRQTHICYYLAC